jgi:Radical SAM superfamily
MQDRKSIAHDILNRFQQDSYTYLGEGFAGVVFHNNNDVFKVHVPLSTNNYGEVDNILYLKQKLDSFKNAKHLFELKDLVCIYGIYILVYPYEKGERVTDVTEDEWISFLSEMWHRKLISRSITKENNFIRVNTTIKLIDYEIEPYSDNLFLNMAARAYIQLASVQQQGFNYDKLKRSIINNFQLEEIQGLYVFIEKLFMNIASAAYPAPVSEDQVVDHKIEVPALNFQDTNHKTSLLIKSCIQDAPFLYKCVDHIITQLSCAEQFVEKVLLLDLYKTDDFLRQYSKEGTREMLIRVANQLLSAGFIDRILIAPEQPGKIEEINFRWFATATTNTHTKDRIPVTSQVFAFEEMRGDYILQMDCDVIIGVRDKAFSIVQDMIKQFDLNANVISVAFPICHDPTMQYQPYFGFENGGFVPEVRNCLFKKDRLLALLPLPNLHDFNGFNLTWYRSLEQKQKLSNYCSIRGGDVRTFYIHPQNYRKENRNVWWTVMNKIENGIIPQCQFEQPEVKGTFYDWTFPKRNESLVLVVIVDNVKNWKFGDFYNSILSQSYQDFGLIIINNTGDSSEDTLAIFKHFQLGLNTTFINNVAKQRSTECIYSAIHYYIESSDSLVCLMHQNDTLLGNSVLAEIINRLSIYNADVLIGKKISYQVLPEMGYSSVDFLNPRRIESNIGNGLQVFKKQLFDSLSIFDLKQRKSVKNHLPGYTKIKNSYEWIEDFENYTILAPIVELSKNPIRFDNFNVFRKRELLSQSIIDNVFNELQSKHPKTEGELIGNRKVFLPNLNKIELDITYDCNLKCLNCNRSCTQAPTISQMSVGQVLNFIEESISLEKKWELINILGGEPTLHPDFLQIVDLLLNKYVIPYSSGTTLQVTSNGYGEFVRSILSQLPEHPNLVINSNSFKDSREVEYFTPFNEAPIDSGNFSDEDYAKGCWVTAYCGVGLNYLGYFPCGVAGGIARVKPENEHIKTLLDVDESIKDKLGNYCRYCGNFSDYHINKGDFMERAEKDFLVKGKVSKIWKDIYRNYNEK